MVTAVAKSRFSAKRSIKASPRSRSFDGRSERVVIANNTGDILVDGHMTRPPLPESFAKVTDHPDQPAARAAAEEECRANPGSTYVLETAAYIVTHVDWSMTLHRVVKMHPYYADH